MFKIRDNVDLKELEKFGYELGQKVLDFQTKVYFKKKRKLFYRIEIVIYVETREIIVYKFSLYKIKGIYKFNKCFKGYEKNIQDIFKAGLVEKVMEYENNDMEL